MSRELCAWSGTPEACGEPGPLAGSGCAPRRQRASGSGAQGAATSQPWGPGRPLGRGVEETVNQ